MAYLALPPPRPDSPSEPTCYGSPAQPTKQREAWRVQQKSAVEQLIALEEAPSRHARSPSPRLYGATPAHPVARTASEHHLTSQRPACGVLTLSRLRPQAAERAADAARAAEEAEGEEGEREAVTNYAAIGKRSMYWDTEKLGDKLQGLDKAGAAAASSRRRLSRRRL